MAEFLVMKTSGNDVPQLGETGTADVYRGDHATLPAAFDAAAAKWKLGPNVRMWGTALPLTRHVTAVSSAPG